MQRIDLHIRDENNHSLAPLTPSDSEILINHGINVNIEQSNKRIFNNTQYLKAGCRLISSGSWRNCNADTYVMGISPLANDEYPLSHKHMFFFNGDYSSSANDKLWKRFILGKGALYSLNIILDSELDEFISNISPDMPPILPEDSTVTISQTLTERLIQIIKNEPANKLEQAFSSYQLALNGFKLRREQAWSEVSRSQRGDPRVDFKTDVKMVLTTGEIKNYESIDISMSGIFLKTTDTFEIATTCSIQINWTIDQKCLPIEIKGEIIRHNKKGIGIFFTNMDMESFEALKELIELSTVY